MSTIRFAPVMAIGFLLAGCTENTVLKFDSGASGTGGDTGTGGSASGGTVGASGGSSGSTGGSSGSTGGSSGSTGGSSGSTGGAPGGGADSGAPSGVDGGGGSGGSLIFGGFNFKGCMTVMSGLTPAQFCSAYAAACMFGKAGYYASMADCMAKFKGLSSDADACKAGKVCNAVNGLKDLDMNCKMAVGACDKSY
jgi:hypothetical protein